MCNLQIPLWHLGQIDGTIALTNIAIPTSKDTKITTQNLESGHADVTKRRDAISHEGQNPVRPICLRMLN